jgi:hypothetical protein
MLRRALAIVEVLVALVCVSILGFGGLTARRVGGDGIGTGIANAFGGAFIAIGIVIGVAAITAWQGRPRWWWWQIAALATAPVALVVTFVVLMMN